MVQISQPITSQLSGVAQALQHIQQPLNEAVKNIEKMANYNQRQTSETMETLKVMTDKLQEKQDSLAHNEQELMQMLESLQKTVQGFQGAVNTTMAVVGEKSGVSPELIKQCFEEWLPIFEKRACIGHCGFTPVQCRDADYHGYKNIGARTEPSSCQSSTDEGRNERFIFSFRTVEKDGIVC